MADTIYTYTGNEFDGVLSEPGVCGTPQTGDGPNGPVTLLVRCQGTAMSITLDTTLTGAAVDNLNLFDITSDIVSFSILNPGFITGGESLDINQASSPGLADAFIISTDSNGNILQWYVLAYYQTPLSVIDAVSYNYGYQPSTAYAIDSNYSYTSDMNGNDPGTWTETTSVPEPRSVLSIVGLGLLGLGLSRRKKSRLPN